MQEEIISEALAGRDVLAVLPTGGGKSVCFQVPALMRKGICIVVTPLIALMKDQVQNLRNRGIGALAVHAGMTRREIDYTLDNAIYGDYKFLYVSPERLRTELFRVRLLKMDVSLLAVDEAHCISQWGYDFRPDYLEIASIRQLLGPAVPVMALTATATPQVAADIMDKLGFKKPNLLTGDFARPNLSYVFRETDDKMGSLLKVCRGVKGSGIVYVARRKSAEDLAAFLRAQGESAECYHAGLPRESRARIQDAWKSGETRIIVSTNAFGMGIDKPDVRLVVHVDIPNSLEEYYQEAGRAGRDGKRAYAVLLVKHTDQRTLKRHITEAFPDKDFIRNVYERVGNFLGVSIGEGFQQMFDFNFNLFCRTFDLPVLPTHNALKILTRAGYIEFVEEIETQSRVMILARKEELYDLDTVTRGADQVLQSILRLYTGLFADYVFINEDVISFRTGLDQETIYKSLLELTRMHILHYVPRKRTPYIIYTTSREEPRHVLLPKAIYEELRQRMTDRVESIINYAYSDEGCRERMLLGYFGETAVDECGHCDLCIDRRKRGDHEPADVQQGILYMAGQRPRRLEDFFNTLSFPRDEIVSMLSFLVDEGFIDHLDDDTYSTAK